MGFAFPLSDGTQVEVDGDLDISRPIVVLLHGLGGSSLHFTDPANALPGTSYATRAVYPFYKDEGIHLTPPVEPFAGFFVDPPTTAVTSWVQALAPPGSAPSTFHRTPAPI